MSTAELGHGIDGYPPPESCPMLARRLVLLATLVVAPLFAACSVSPTGPRETTETTPPPDTTKRDQAPWH
jgi:hypothetical protein